MKKIFYAAFITLFFAVCLTPSAGMLVLGESQPAANEILASKPQLKNEDGSVNTSLNDDITSYISDRMAFRQEIITAYAAVKVFLTGESASEDVLTGENGWLFYSRTLDDYLRRNTLSLRSINGIARTVKMMQDYANAQGVDFKFTIAPNKNSLYDEYMPDVGNALDHEKNADMLAEALNAEGAAYADLFSVFENQSEVLYHRRDSHWTNRGAALARDILMGVYYGTSEAEERASGSEDFALEEGFFTGGYKIVKNHRGDLYEMLYPAGQALDEDAEFNRRFTFGYADGPDSYYDESRPPDDRILIETVNGNASGSLLMFRDSFGNSLYPFMAESYGHAVFSRMFPYDLSMLNETEVGDNTGADTDAAQPDAGAGINDRFTSLIIEIVERNIPDLASESPVMPAPLVDFKEAGISGSELKDIDIVCGAEESDQMQGCTLIRGVYDGGSLPDDVRIFICGGSEYYEACPVGNTDWLADEADKWSGDCCFSAYVPEELNIDGIESIIFKSDGLCIKSTNIVYADHTE